MIPDLRGPKGLAPDEPWLADPESDRRRNEDAERGSRNLRNAILALLYGSEIGRRYSKGRHSRPSRMSAREHVLRIQQAAVGHLGMTMADITSRRGKKHLVRKRQIVMYVARRMTEASYPDLGYCFGHRDHTTIIHGCRVVEADSRYRMEAAELRARISA